jgi:hypothetical protein
MACDAAEATVSQTNELHGEEAYKKKPRKFTEHTELWRAWQKSTGD